MPGELRRSLEDELIGLVPQELQTDMFETPWGTTRFSRGLFGRPPDAKHLEKVLRDLQSWIFFAGGDSTMIGNYLTTYGRKPEMDHQMVRDLGLSWRAYDGGAVHPNGDPSMPAVAPKPSAERMPSSQP